MEISCESRIEAVTVHPRGALVTRVVTLSALPDGDVDLRVPGLPLGSDPGTLRVEVRGGARRVVAAAVAVEVPAGVPSVGATVAEVERLEDEIAARRDEAGWLVAERRKLEAVRVAPRLRPGALDGRVDERLADALAASSLVGAIEEQIDGRLAALEDELFALERALDAAQLADAQTSSEARRGPLHPTRTATVRLDGSGAPERLSLTYVVRAARWWPAYTLRLRDGGAKASWQYEAWVAQRSGEDWSGVALSLSTADMILDARMPELPSLRIGRAAPQKERRGYRPAPSGLDALFAGYARAFDHVSRAVTPGAGPPALAPLVQVAIAAPKDEGKRRAKPQPAMMIESAAPPPPAPPPPQSPASMSLPGAPPPMMQAAPMAEMLRSAAPPQAKKGAAMRSPAPARAMALDVSAAAPPAPPMGGGGAAYGADAEEASLPDDVAGAESIEPGEQWLHFDRLVLAGNDDRARRGRLVATAADTVEGDATQLEGAAPAGVRDPIGSRGHFDHRWDAAGRVQVPSDGLAHRVTVAEAEGEARSRYRTVPREAPEVYRELLVKNPFGAPLLAGPVDVYVGGALLLVAQLAGIDTGGAFTVGLGVEERLRVARNVHYDEKSAGFLGSSTATEAEVAIELRSALGHAVEVEVLDRHPTSGDNDLEVKLVSSTPPATPYKQTDRGRPIEGGLQFLVKLPPAGKGEARFRYRMTHASKMEIVGGSRRG